MNNKVLHTLEYYKILDKLSQFAACEDTRKRCLELVPITDLDEINQLQLTTADALSRLYKKSNISFTGLSNIKGALKRLEIGGSLGTTELLQISSLLEIAKRAKAYDRSDKSDEKTDSLSGFFEELEPLTPLCEEIKRCIISADEIADDASTILSKIRKSIRGMNDNKTYEQQHHQNSSSGCCCNNERWPLLPSCKIRFKITGSGNGSRSVFYWFYFIYRTNGHRKS